jgi:hypothetical protein
MALSKTLSVAVYGIDANLIDVEVDYSGVLALRTISIRLDYPTPPCAKAAIACGPQSRTPAT